VLYPSELRECETGVTPREAAGFPGRPSPRSVDHGPGPPNYILESATDRVVCPVASVHAAVICVSSFW